MKAKVYASISESFEAEFVFVPPKDNSEFVQIEVRAFPIDSIAERLFGGHVSSFMLSFHNSWSQK